MRVSVLLTGGGDVRNVWLSRAQAGDDDDYDDDNVDYETQTPMILSPTDTAAAAAAAVDDDVCDDERHMDHAARRDDDIVTHSPDSCSSHNDDGKQRMSSCNSCKCKTTTSTIKQVVRVI